MNNQWHKKESPLQGLTGLWGGLASNLTGGLDLVTNSLQWHYDESSSPGLQTINFGGTTRTLNYATYNSKGWAEICFIGNVPYGHHTTASFRTGQTMIDENLHASNGGLDYTANISKVMVGTDMTPTDFVITSKNSRTNSAINSNMGQNESSALPLTKSNIVGTDATECQDAMMAFWRGTQSGFSAYATGNYSEVANNAQYRADWQGEQPDGYAIQLLSRSGSTDTDHWFIASGQGDSGSTYHANIGFRATTSTGSWYAKNVGSWSSNSSPKLSQYQMSSTNVFSFWLTDM